MSGENSPQKSKLSWKLPVGFLGVFALGAASTYGLMKLDQQWADQGTVAQKTQEQESLQNNPDHQMARATIKKNERERIDPGDLQRMDQMWDDFDQQFAQIQKEMNERFGSFFGDVKDSFYDEALKVSEERQGSKIIVKIDLGDVDAESLAVNIDNQMIHIKGQRSLHSENQGQFGNSMTRSISSFSRAFSLPEGASPEGATVKKSDGEIVIVFNRVAV